MSLPIDALPGDGSPVALSTASTVSPSRSDPSRLETPPPLPPGLAQRGLPRRSFAGRRTGVRSETGDPRTPFESSSAGPAVGGLPRAGLATGDVVRVIGVSRRQLQYWAETGLVAPSARTRGGHRRYTFADLVALKAAKQLIDAGVSVQRIRSSVGALERILPQVRHPLSELVLVATGDVVLVLREGAVFEALSGQEWIVEVAQFQREIERVLGSSEAALSQRRESRPAVKVATRREAAARSA